MFLANWAMLLFRKGIRSILLNRFERDGGVGEGKSFLKSFSFPHLKPFPFSYARVRVRAHIYKEKCLKREKK